MFIINSLTGFGASRATTFSTTYNPSLTANSTGFGGLTHRTLIAASLFSASGSSIRITLTPPTSGNNTNIGACYIGKKGASAPDFDGGQVQVTFGGSATTTLTAGGSPVVSDEIPFAFDHTVDHIISYYMSGTSDVRYANGVANVTRYYKSGNDAAGTSTTGYTSNAGFLDCIDLVEAGN